MVHPDVMADVDLKRDLEWADAQISTYAKRRPDYDTYARTLTEILEAASRTLAPNAIVKARSKTVASFGEKIWRKKDKRRDPVEQFTDLCGVRVITHSPGEVAAVSKFIEANFDIDTENSVDARQRLKPTEFGYLSVHYIVRCREDTGRDLGVDPTILDTLLSMPNGRAEIQVRTILEHAWADLSHDLIYKSTFQVPKKWERESAGLAAVLENAEGSFARIQSSLGVYRTSYGSYMDGPQMRAEIEKLLVVLKHDPRNARLAGRIGNLATLVGEWQQAIDVLSPFAESGIKALLRDLGTAKCEKNRGKTGEEEAKEYAEGQALLEEARQPPDPDVYAVVYLASTRDGNRARELYREAFELDPSDPTVLRCYLQSEIAYRRDVSFLTPLRPVLRAAITLCRDRADVGVDLPQAFYDIGAFSLLNGDPYDSLTAYAKAVELSPSAATIAAALRSLKGLAEVAQHLEGFEWVCRLLLVALALASDPEGAEPEVKAAKDEVKALASPGCEPLPGPVVILAGGCSSRVEAEMRSYQPLLLEAFRHFRGALICGGTTEGISGIAGDVGQAYSETIHTIGYIPASVPADATIDRNTDRVREIRKTDGHEFTPLAPLQNWIDLIATGMGPSDLKVVGVNGGRIAGVEYRLGLALGALVGVVEGSGREVPSLLSDPDWASSPGLIRLPSEHHTIRAFVSSWVPAPGDRLAHSKRETMGTAIHESFRANQRSRGRASTDPSMADWEELVENLKEGNRQQADFIFAALDAIGCSVHQVGENAALLELTPAEVEVMAEMEHSRWNLERLADGWVWGSPKDIEKKISPYLEAWHELKEEIREYDREAVREFPAILALVGLEVRRREPASP